MSQQTKERMIMVTSFLVVTLLHGDFCERQFFPWIFKKKYTFPREQGFLGNALLSFQGTIGGLELPLA